MPKMKTHKGTSKRIRMTKAGKILRASAATHRCAPPHTRDCCSILLLTAQNRGSTAQNQIGFRLKSPPPLCYDQVAIDLLFQKGAFP